MLKIDYSLVLRSIFVSQIGTIISKIESEKSVTFSTIIRVFKAMGVNSANLDLGSLGKVALW